MLSKSTQRLVLLLGICYAVIGAIMFFAPAWAAPRFAWKVSEFVTMTMGGWCLGNAWGAIATVRQWRFSLSATALLYFALFGILETAVVVLFRERLVLDHWIAWLYLATLAFNVFVVLFAAVDWMRTRPPFETEGPTYGPWALAFGIAFQVFVAFLGYYGLTAGPGSRGLNASIFPEVITPFTLRAFGAFYLSLALATLPLLYRRGLNNALQHALAGWGLIIFITIAAFANIGLFDFAGRPTQALYIGVYLLVAVITGAYLWRYRGLRQD